MNTRKNLNIKAEWDDDRVITYDEALVYLMEEHGLDEAKALRCLEELALWESRN
jgi:2-hydroxychromene-2-carboxylate isomerase